MNSQEWSGNLFSEKLLGNCWQLLFKMTLMVYLRCALCFVFHKIIYDLLPLVARRAEADVYPEGGGGTSGSLLDELVEGEMGAHPFEPLASCL